MTTATILIRFAFQQRSPMENCRELKLMLSKNLGSFVFVIDLRSMIILYMIWAGQKKESYGKQRFDNFLKLYTTIHEGSALTED